MDATFVIIGGGIAGVTCAETLAFYNSEDTILLVSESALIKTVTNLLAITEALTQFDIVESDLNSLEKKYLNLRVIHDVLFEVRFNNSEVILKSGSSVKYKYLCLCMGATPKLIKQAENNPFVLGIRDTDSVEVFINKLREVKKVLVVGNGGIASELVYKIENADVDWVVKDRHISSTFVDPGAAHFFESALKKSSVSDKSPSKRMRFTETTDSANSGAALGPDWYKLLEIKGALSRDVKSNVRIHYESEIDSIENGNKTVNVKLKNGKVINTEIVISATGVVPRTGEIVWDRDIELSHENGYVVDEHMKTSLKNIFAAGDICTANWQHATHWFPMKLWTQARQMGSYAAKCMSLSLAGEQILQDFCFEIFTHTTKLFGYKVILLGLYNGQKLNNDYEILLRVTKDMEYIKLVMKNDRLQGAVLIGDTDLEETFENLILNQLDLSSYKEDLLNPDIDIEDYFD